ncbi:MAG: DUF2520 domain-containing protein [Bdellovibrionales bacterium]|nr:DUF2520 domain-containing protein [Bdellovibrionales bacterium]
MAKNLLPSASSQRFFARGVNTREFIPLFVGRGRLARHLVHFFKSSSLPYLQFSDARAIGAKAEYFANIASASTHVWLLVSDKALEPVQAEVLRLMPTAQILHSSAATKLAGATTLHPLMTFSTEVYARDVYSRIPWVTFDDEPTVQTSFGNVTSIPGSMRIKYHAACVMIANFSQILWSAAEGLNPVLPTHAWGPILRQTLENFLVQGSKALTGPLVRGDQATVRAHERALEGSREADLYASFVKYFQNGGSYHDHRT